jgi:hypothetical protein
LIESLKNPFAASARAMLISGRCANLQGKTWILTKYLLKSMPDEFLCRLASPREAS